MVSASKIKKWKSKARAYAEQAEAAAERAEAAAERLESQQVSAAAADGAAGSGNGGDSEVTVVPSDGEVEDRRAIRAALAGWPRRRSMRTSRGRLGEPLDSAP